MITIHQEALSPNMANTPLLYVATSNSSSNFNYRFVLDIKDEDDKLIQRIKQQPNPSGKGVFNITNIITTNVGPTDTIFEITASQANTSCGKDFKIKIGEEYNEGYEYALPTLYDGNGNVGNPATSGSAYNFIIDGVVDEDNAKGWNWDSGSKYEEELTDDVNFTHQFGLTNFNTQSVYSEDYATISILNGNLNGIAPSTAHAQDVFCMVFNQYDSDDVKLGSVERIWNTSGPRDNGP